MNTAIDAPMSPCIGLCKLNDDSGFCEGCWRDMDEIVQWPKASSDEQREILQRVAERRAAGKAED